MTAALLLVAAALLLAFGALMASIDAALGVTSRADLAELGAAGRNAAILHRIAADPEAHANAVIFIRVLAETTAAVLVTVAFTLLFENIWWAMLAAAVLMTGVSYVVVGASPRSVGRLHAKGLLRSAAPVIRGVRIILGPLAHGLVALGTRITPGASRGSSFASEEQLLSIIDEAAENALIEQDDRELIHSVFDFTDTFVRAVMVPRTDMVTVDASASTRDAMTIFLDNGISRVPVVDDEADDVIGVLYLKDLVQFGFRDESGWRDAPITRITRPAVFVPESMKAESLLQQMKRDAVHVCLVIDEYGGVSGLVTLEDLIEELVGEIADEYDPRADEVTEMEPGHYRVSARLGLDEVGDLFGIELEDEDVDSIGGLLGKALGRVPQPGATAEYAGLVLTGGAARGRGRGISTVFVERGEGRPDNDRSPRTGEIRTTGTRTGEVRVSKKGENP
ncbi:hemolysin family protein [Microbacterium allomyrinae]|jgi:CBS domain containing-hemolysin-like protein|uniref:HlyC/CorC family transporter n=1 Tax=Microbacterium allomyrinae TaxID=2830666 RepID=A0A9X1LUU5_9MICO|nr:hemolysin family protein [Microbacterium allomyrinae]MCC2032237.1 HlyC/CorC family transporter [Microbacterium allomyrinae]